jgi:hypothetical protein
VIAEWNGVLIPDSVEGVTKGLQQILASLTLFDSQRIIDDARRHSWPTIVNDNLAQYFEAIRSGPPSRRTTEFVAVGALDLRQ